MDYRQGVTITPMIAYDERGQEIIDYDHAVVEDHAIRRQQYDQVQAEQEQYVTEFSDGSRQHYYDIDEEGEYFDEGRHTISEYEEEDEWESEEEEDEYDPEDEDFVDAVLETIYEHICPEEEYDAMLEWAEESIDPDEIEQFNDVMDSGDPKAILTWIHALVSNLAGGR